MNFSCKEINNTNITGKIFDYYYFYLIKLTSNKSYKDNEILIELNLKNCEDTENTYPCISVTDNNNLTIPLHLSFISKEICRVIAIYNVDSFKVPVLFFIPKKII